MRPAGEIRQALMQAVAAYPTGATLQELAGRARVGIQVASCTVKNMHRAGVLVKTGERRVAYRNRPVAVYAAQSTACVAKPAPGAELAAVLGCWA